MDQLNDFLLKYLDENFMLEFISNAKAALEYTAGVSYENMAKAVETLEAAIPVYQREELNKKEAYETYKIMQGAVMATVDP